jgi:hypothetical protein
MRSFCCLVSISNAFRRDVPSFLLFGVCGLFLFSRTVFASNSSTYFLNIKDRGAKGDGITDDTAVIKNAMTLGVPLYFPPGIYSVKEELNYSPATRNCQFIGSNVLDCLVSETPVNGSCIRPGTEAIIRYDGPPNPAIAVIRASQKPVKTAPAQSLEDSILSLQIRNITIDANDKAGYAIYIARSMPPTVLSNVSALRATQDGIYVNHQFYGLFEHLIASENGRHGIAVGTVNEDGVYWDNANVNGTLWRDILTNNNGGNGIKTRFFRGNAITRISGNNLNDLGVRDQWAFANSLNTHADPFGNTINARYVYTTWTNVTQYGATPNNDGDDDSVAIKNAIATGLPVFFPPGEYHIRDQLDITKNAVLLGVGTSRWAESSQAQIGGRDPTTLETTISFAGAADPQKSVIRVSGGHFEMRDMGINGKNLTGYGLSLENTTDPLISGVNVRRTTSDGMRINSQNGGVFELMAFTLNKGNALSIGSSTTNSGVSNTFFRAVNAASNGTSLAFHDFEEPTGYGVGAWLGTNNILAGFVSETNDGPNYVFGPTTGEGNELFCAYSELSSQYPTISDPKNAINSHRSGHPYALWISSPTMGLTLDTFFIWGEEKFGSEWIRLKGLNPTNPVQFKNIELGRGILADWDNYTLADAADVLTANQIIKKPYPRMSSYGPAVVQGNSVTLSWTTDIETYGQVEYGTSKSYGDRFPEQIVVTTNTVLSTAHSVTITGLERDTKYHYRIISRTESELPVASSNRSFFTDQTAPTIPPSPQAIGQEQSILLSWQPSTDSGGSGLKGYRVDVSTNNSFSVYVPGWENYDVGLSTNATSDGLRASTTYYARVRAEDGAGNISPNSPVVFAKTLKDTILPSKPGNVQLVPQDKAIQISWDPSTDTGGSGLWRYLVYVSTDSNDPTALIPGWKGRDVGLETQVTAQGVTPDTTYFVRVRAMDGDTNSKYSDWVATQTLPEIPGPYPLVSIDNDAYNHFGIVSKDEEGRLHLVYRKASDHVTKGIGVYRFSDDNGMTWSALQTIIPQGLLDPDDDVRVGCIGTIPRSVKYPQGRIFVAYSHKTPSRQNWRFATSNDRGTTWVNNQPFDGDKMRNGIPYGRMIHLPDGRLLVTGYTYNYPGQPSGQFELGNWMSSDQGDTWERAAPVTTYTSTSGYLYSEHSIIPVSSTTWLSVSRGQNSFNFFKSTDSGQSWFPNGEMDETVYPGQAYTNLVAPMLDRIPGTTPEYVLLTYADRETNRSYFRIGRVVQFIGDSNSPIVWGPAHIYAHNFRYRWSSGYQSGVFIGEQPSRYLLVDYDEQSPTSSVVRQFELDLTNPALFEEVLAKEIGMDGIAPTLSIAAPASGAILTSTNTVSITASALDNVGVSKVWFIHNGLVVSTSTAAPYEHAWTIAASDNGSHHWSAIAFDAAGNSSTSAAIPVTVAIDATPPTVPQDLLATVLANAINLSWSPSTDTGGSGLGGYQVDVSSDMGDSYLVGWQRRDVGNVVDARVTGLTSATTYYFRLRAYDAAGNVSPPSATLSATTPRAPLVAPNGSVTTISPRSISAKWDSSTNATRYTLAGSLSNNPAGVFSLQRESDQTDDTLTGLTPNTTYFLFLNACDDDRCTDYTPLGPVVTHAVVPGLTVERVEGNNVNLTIDPRENPAGTVYRVEARQKEGEFVAKVVGTSLSPRMGDLTPGQHYWFRVLAVNHAGVLSGPSNETDIETPPNTIEIARAYPNPFRSGGAANGITFDKLPEGASVRLFTIDGREVATLTAGSDGKALWTLTNGNGSQIASGVYLAYIKNGGETRLLKVMVQK